MRAKASASPRAGLLSTLALACGAALAGCSSGQVVVHVSSTPETNGGQPFYLVARAGDRAGYVAESYDSVAAALLGPDERGARVAQAIYPGIPAKVVVQCPERAGLAVWALFTEPGRCWRAYREAPLAEPFEVVVDGNDLKSVGGRVVAEGEYPAAEEVHLTILARSFAGRWTRNEDRLTFAVTDVDGVVSGRLERDPNGELVGASFVLRRDDGALVGTATFKAKGGGEFSAPWRLAPSENGDLEGERSIAPIDPETGDTGPTRTERQTFHVARGPVPQLLEGGAPTGGKAP